MVTSGAAEAQGRRSWEGGKGWMLKLEGRLALDLQDLVGHDLVYIPTARRGSRQGRGLAWWEEPEGGCGLVQGTGGEWPRPRPGKWGAERHSPQVNRGKMG